MPKAERAQPTFEEELRRLYPGQKVPLDPSQPDGPGVTVYPAGVRHLTEFSEALGNVLYEVLTSIDEEDIERPGLGAPEEVKTKVGWLTVQRLLPGLTRSILRDVVALVGKCCKPNPFNIVDPSLSVPHWYGGAIISAWVEQSFDTEDKVRPWVRAMERLIEKLTGERIDLWEKVSQLSSPAAIDSVKSYMRSSLASLTEAGRSPSSEPTSSPPREPKTDGGPTSSETSTSGSPRHSEAPAEDTSRDASVSSARG